MHFRPQNSIKLCHTGGGNHGNELPCGRKVGGDSSLKIVGQKPLILTLFFDDFETIGRISSEQNVTLTIGQGRWKGQGASYIVSKFHELGPQTA